MSDSYFCLDIGENLIKLVDAKQSGNQIVIQNMACVTAHDIYYSDIEKGTEPQAKIIEKLVTSAKLSKKNVNIVIPDSITYSQILEMPRLNEKELISAIRYQADQFIPMPIDETTIDLEILSENEANDKLLVLMVAAPKKIVEKIQNTIELAGLIPETVENELSAVSRFIVAFYKILYDPNSEGSIIVNIGYNSTSLYYYNAKKALTLHSHTFNIGYKLFVKELQINLNIDPQKSVEILKAFNGQQKISVPIESILAPILKQFSLEIKHFIALIADKYHVSIQDIHIINDGFRFIYLSYYLQQTINLQTDLLNPDKVCRYQNNLKDGKDALPLYTAAIGGNIR